MNKLKLEYLAPYLPYGLKVSKIHTLHARQGIGNIYHVIDAVNEGKLQYRPILRPLSDLTKEIDHNGERFVPIKRLVEFYDFEYMVTTNYNFKDNQGCYYCAADLPYNLVIELLKWNFDVFDLHSKGLCIYHDELK